MISLLFLTMLATASTAVPPPEVSSRSQDAEVNGLQRLYRLASVQLREAVNTYDHNYLRLAPDAPLLFEIRTRNSISPLADVKLWLMPETSGEPLPLAHDAKGHFVLPPLSTDGTRYALQANRAVGDVRIVPLILSPGTTAEDRRLGDLRLQCIIESAIEWQAASVSMQELLGAAGAMCTNSEITMYQDVTRPLATATIRTRTETRSLTVAAKGMKFLLPTGDASLPNDARVGVTYLTP